MYFWFGTVVSVDWRLSFFPPANNVMDTFGSLYTISSQTHCQHGYLALLLINNDRGLLSFVSMRVCVCARMHEHVFLCFVLWSVQKPNLGVFEQGGIKTHTF